MGIAGAAIASSFAELCSLIILSIHVLRKMDRKVYGLNWQFNKNIFHHVCRVSIWSMFNPFIGVASWFAFFIAIEHLGDWNYQTFRTWATSYPNCYVIRFSENCRCIACHVGRLTDRIGCALRSQPRQFWRSSSELQQLRRLLRRSYCFSGAGQSINFLARPRRICLLRPVVRHNR